MTFNLLMAKRVFHFGQYDRINDLVAFNLRGDKRLGLKEFLVGEFHPSAVCKCFSPLFVHRFPPEVSNVALPHRASLFAVGKDKTYLRKEQLQVCERAGH
jgi:hypothetical protein